MRVNDVTMMRMDGATLSTVKRAISCTMRPVALPPPSPKSRLNVCAAAG